MIKQNKQPKLKKYEMICDKALSKNLEKYPTINEHLNKQNTSALVGTQGQGKTTLLLNLVVSIYRKCFHETIVVTPEQSRRSIKNDIFKIFRS